MTTKCEEHHEGTYFPTMISARDWVEALTRGHVVKCCERALTAQGYPCAPVVNRRIERAIDEALQHNLSFSYEGDGDSFISFVVRSVSHEP